MRALLVRIPLGPRPSLHRLRCGRDRFVRRLPSYSGIDAFEFFSRLRPTRCSSCSAGPISRCSKRYPPRGASRSRTRSCLPIRSHGLKPETWRSTDFTMFDPDAFIASVINALPKKRKLTVAEIAELKREHAVTIEPGREARDEIFALERKLSDLVNDAYGLTPEEVQLMWNTAPPRMPFTPSGLTTETGAVEANDQSDDDTEA